MVCQRATLQVGKQAERQIDRQAERQIDRQAERQIDRQAGRQACKKNHKIGICDWTLLHNGLKLFSK